VRCGWGTGLPAELFVVEYQHRVVSCSSCVYTLPKPDCLRVTGEVTTLSTTLGLHLRGGQRDWEAGGVGQGDGAARHVRRGEPSHLAGWCRPTEAGPQRAGRACQILPATSQDAIQLNLLGFKLRCLTWPVISAGPNAPGPAAYHATERLAVRTTRRRGQQARSASER